MFGALIWEGEVSKAREILEAGIEDLSRADDVVAGWHNVQIAGCYEIEGDRESALVNYQRARARLGINFAYPRSLVTEEDRSEQRVGRMERLLDLLLIGSPTSFVKQFNRWKIALASVDSGSYSQVEEALRALGELLGFDSTRPDNQFQTGPDVLWRDPSAKQSLPLEVKSDKEEDGVYYKKDIAQLGDSVNWVVENYSEDAILRKVIVGPKGTCAQDANPDDMMWLALIENVTRLRDEVLGLVEDLRKIPPRERRDRLLSIEQDGRYGLPALAERLQDP